RIAPHAAFANVDGTIAHRRAMDIAVAPVPVGITGEVVGGAASIVAANHAETADRVDDAVYVAAEDAGRRIDLAAEVRHVAAQDATFEIVELRSGDQAKVHA